MKTVVFVRGGVVQGVITDHESEVLIVDYDADEIEDYTLTIEGDEANVWSETAGEGSFAPDRVRRIFKKYQARQTRDRLKGSFGL